MKINNVQNVSDLIATVDKCRGSVWIESRYGDRLSLTSPLSRYVAIASLIKDEAEDLELFCALPEDEQFFFELFNKNPKILNS